MINPSHVTRAMMYFQTSALMLTQMVHTFGALNTYYVIVSNFHHDVFFLFTFQMSTFDMCLALLSAGC